MLRFYNCDLQIYNFLQNFAAHLIPCGGTPVTLCLNRTRKN
jgi:hypothetical protein